MGLMCPQPQLGPAAFLLVQDVPIHRSHESRVGYGFNPYAKLWWLAGRLYLLGSVDVVQGVRCAQRAEEVGAVQVDGALSSGLRARLGCSVASLLFPSLLATKVGVLKLVLSCLYPLVQYWMSHLFIESKVVFPFSYASPGTGKHVSGSCCYWQLSDR